MKYIYVLIAVSVLFFLSCKKSKIESEHVASINITNVVIGGKALRFGSSSTDSVTNMNFKQFSLKSGYNSIYLWPSGDSSNPYYNSAIDLEDGDYYSLFIAGNNSKQIDPILIKDNIDQRLDNTTGVRFINLSPNSIALNITLSNSPTKNELSNLKYKQISNFVTYSSFSSSGSYIFQVRNASDSSLLTTFTLTTPRFDNVTLVIRGLINASPSIGVIRVSNDR